MIIPTLNEEKNIQILLNLLYNQTYKNFEVIIVDGNSKDDTKKMAMEYKNKLKLKLYPVTKRHPAYQRNYGVLKSKCDLLLFIDADTLFDSVFIENSLNEIKRKKLISAGPKIIPEVKIWPYTAFFYFVNNILNLFSFIKPCYPGHCLFSHKKEHNQIGGFNEDINVMHDLIYVNSVSKLGKFRIINTKSIYSLRRFEQYGVNKTMFNWIKFMAYFLLNSGTKSNKMGYIFGEYT